MRAASLALALLAACSPVGPSSPRPEAENDLSRPPVPWPDLASPSDLANSSDAARCPFPPIGGPVSSTDMTISKAVRAGRDLVCDALWAINNPPLGTPSDVLAMLPGARGFALDALRLAEPVLAAAARGEDLMVETWVRASGAAVAKALDSKTYLDRIGVSVADPFVYFTPARAGCDYLNSSWFGPFCVPMLR